MTSKLDRVYRRILQTKFFNKGWGKPENLKRLFEFRKTVSNRETCYHLVNKDYPITITKEEEYGGFRLLEGEFLSPFAIYQKGLLPPESESAYFQVLLPKKWHKEDYKPICLQLAGTGDHGFWRRRKLVAQPLLKEAGISSIILENPFYGLRKPKDQVRSSLRNVSDIFVMGGCLILESLALFHWCERNGLGPLGITGLSMGGHMASLAATNWPKPLVLVPCLSWSTASPVFTQGVMSSSIDWKLLQTQYVSDETLNEVIKKMVQLDQDAFKAGQHFAQHYPESMEHIKQLKKENNVPDPRNIGPTQEKNKQFEIYYSGTKLTESTISGNSEEKNHIFKNSEVQLIQNNSSANESSNLNSDLQCVQSPESMKKSVSGFLSLDFLRKSKFLSFDSDTKQKKNVTKIPAALTNAGDCTDEAVLKKWRDNEVLEFMRGIMDDFTDLRNFSKPVDTELIIAVCARNDAYVPRKGAAELTDIWPGSEIRFLDAGHVSAYLFHQNIFRKAIIECFARLEKKYLINEGS